MSQPGFEARFIEAISRLCGGKAPDPELVRAWFRNESELLQEFCLAHGPNWAQGIAVIDAAHVLAEEGIEEGLEFEDLETYLQLLAQG